MRLRSSIAAFGFLAAAASPLLADEPGSAGPKSWGTTSQTVLTLGPCDAAQRDMTNPFQVFSCDFLTAKQPNTFNTAAPGFPLHLPEGALLEQVDVSYYDTINESEPFVSLTRTGAGPTDQIINNNLPVWNQGDNTSTFLIDPPRVIHNDNSIYSLTLQLDTVDAMHYTGLYYVSIRYRLQVSPPPATATFADVPTGHPFFQFVEALAASGITAGCGNGNFCPNTPLTRGQMAVFLSKALGLHWPNSQLPN